MNVIYSNHISMDLTGQEHVTEQLQSLIDEASRQEACLVLRKGIYLTGPLFLRSHMEFHFEDGAVLLGTIDETKYPLIFTRVAGIEMDWYPAILNCIDASDVIISGQGTIDGQGPYWWNKYWGKDTNGGMRKEYDAKGLRFACDYDCKRPRNVLISNSKNVQLKDFTSYHSGFWNIHILYSEHIIVNGVTINSFDLNSPSTDGIDIDSSVDVTIVNSTLMCNDDSISIKSGRDEDGKRVGKPCHDIHIKNCFLKAGFGITIGSEVSGRVFDVNIEDITYDGTDCGFRIKSSAPRGGSISNIHLKNLKMKNVHYLFHLFLNWNPDYCHCVLPKDYTGPIYPHYEVLTQKSAHPCLTKVEHIDVQNVCATMDGDYKGISRAFHIEGYAKQPMEDISFTNMKIMCKEYGCLNYIQDVHFENCDFTILEQEQKENDVFDNR